MNYPTRLSKQLLVLTTKRGKLSKIRLQGVSTHNLKHIDVEIPRDKLVVLTGLSGSGKSSLAFDTLYAEGQRRYVESLSSYARQFLSVMAKPQADLIEGLSPAISIEQKTISHNPRSTVGTITEIYDYIRLLFARVGEPHCPKHKIKLASQTISQMVDRAMGYNSGEKIMILSPVIRHRKGSCQSTFLSLKSQGYVRVRINSDMYTLDDLPDLDKNKKHSVDVVVDRLSVRDDIQQRLAEAFELATTLSDGLAIICPMDSPEKQILLSSRFACPECNFSLTNLQPRLFSFNGPQGACPQCDGLGVNQDFDPEKIIADPTLSMAQGAIRGWGKRHFYFFQLIESLAEHFDFDTQTSFNELPEKIQKIILYGSGNEVIDFYHLSPRGQKVLRTHSFEGIIPNMQRRYNDTERSSVRDDLSQFLSQSTCQSCEGSRLNLGARNVMINDKSIHQVTAMSIKQAKHFIDHIELEGFKKEIGNKIRKEISTRLSFLINVGLDYLSLSRSAETLSGGEGQRIRLASQIGSALVGVMYILDEPSIGLHQRDNDRLIQTLRTLRDLGNTVIVVEHDEDTIRAADHVIDIGPGAGCHGGEVVAAGKPNDIQKVKRSITGQYLSGKAFIPLPTKRRTYNNDEVLSIFGANTNNLKSIDAHFPLKLLTCVTGVSGSGKSSLVNDTLLPAILNAINKKNNHFSNFSSIAGHEHIDKVISIDQSPIGRTPRSNPATYTGLFTTIRELFAATEDSRARGYQVGRFSFNVKGGRCEACSGDGLIKVEMHFLADIYVECDTCKGTRYNRETLEIKYKGKNIHEVLSMSVEDSLAFFEKVPVLKRKIQTLMDVGLSYISLGQSATTLSGGEAQRIKLSRELSKRDTGKTLYFFDEPTTGLHFHDVKQLTQVLLRLRDRGNTLIIIEHHLDIIKCADHIIDLGPEGGSHGGEIIASGTPNVVAECKDSLTGKFLKPLLLKDYKGKSHEPK